MHSCPEFMFKFLHLEGIIEAFTTIIIIKSMILLPSFTQVRPFDSQILLSISTQILLKSFRLLK